MIKTKKYDNSKPFAPLELTPIQKQYLNDWDHRFFITSAGRRSRKTRIGRRKLMYRALLEKGNYAFCAPTIDQALGLFWNELKIDTGTLNGIQLRSHIDITHHRVTLHNGSTIRVLSLDKPDRIEGQEWHGFHITEAANVKESAIYENVLPTLIDTGGFMILDSVPESKNWFYDIALQACGGSIPKTRHWHGAHAEDGDWAFYTWFSSDVVLQSELDKYKKLYPEKLYNQEYLGSFESRGNTVYYDFNRETHVLERANLMNSGLSLGCGMDFNVDYLTAEIFLYDYDRRMIHYIDEIRLSDSNTYEMAAELNKRYPAIDVYPDATGTARKTSSTQSDHAILNNAGFATYCNKSNPEKQDRVNAANALIKNMNGDISLTVDPKCKYLIEDFERVTWDIMKKNNYSGPLTHAVDAGTYPIHYLFPIRIQQQAQSYIAY